MIIHGGLRILTIAELYQFLFVMLLNYLQFLANFVKMCIKYGCDVHAVNDYNTNWFCFYNHVDQKYSIQYCTVKDINTHNRYGTEAPVVLRS